MLLKLCMVALATACTILAVQADLKPLVSINGRYSLTVGARGHPLTPSNDLSPGSDALPLTNSSFLAFDKPHENATVAYFAIITSFSRLNVQKFRDIQAVNFIDFTQPATATENLSTHLPRSQFLVDFPGSDPVVWSSKASITIDSWQQRNQHQSNCSDNSCFPVFSALNVLAGQGSTTLPGSQAFIDLLNAGPAGRYRVRFYDDLDHKYTRDVTDGHTFAIVWSRPDFPDTRNDGIALYFGGLSNQASQNINFALSLNTTDTESFLDMGIGISYSEGGEQRSTIKINGATLTSSAGGANDGSTFSSLITVGSSVDDDKDFPPNPLDVTYSDDEFYSLRPFLAAQGGSPVISTIALDFNNPSSDDQLFFLSLESSVPLPVSFVITPTSDPVCPTDAAIISAVVNRVVDGAITGTVNGATVELCDVNGASLDTAQTDSTGSVVFTIANAPDSNTVYRLKYASTTQDVNLVIKAASECFELVLSASEPCPGALLVTALVKRVGSASPVDGITVILKNAADQSFTGVTGVDGPGKVDITFNTVGSYDSLEVVQGSAAAPGGTITKDANIQLLSQALCDTSFCPDKEPTKVGTDANRYWEVTADCVSGQGAKAVKIHFPPNFVF